MKRSYQIVTASLFLLASLCPGVDANAQNSNSATNQPEPGQIPPHPPRLPEGAIPAFNKTILIASEAINAVNHQYISAPLVSLTFPKQKVNATSNSPATIRIIQFIPFLRKGQQQVCEKILQMLKKELSNGVQL